MLVSKWLWHKRRPFSQHFSSKVWKLRLVKGLRVRFSQQSPLKKPYHIETLTSSSLFMVRPGTFPVRHSCCQKKSHSKGFTPKIIPKIISLERGGRCSLTILCGKNHGAKGLTTEHGCRGGFEETLLWPTSGSSMEPRKTNRPTFMDLILHRDSCSSAVSKPCGVQPGDILKICTTSRQLHSMRTLTMPLAVGPAPARGVKIQPSAKIGKHWVSLHLANRCKESDPSADDL